MACDPITHFVVYTGSMSAYVKFGGGPHCGFVGTFRLGHFPVFVYPSPKPPLYPWAVPDVEAMVPVPAHPRDHVRHSADY